MTFRDFPTGRFYNGDCLEIMKEIPDGVIDMILCDLPYGTTQNKWDTIIPFDLLWEEYWRICKGAVVLTASQPFTSKLVLSNIDNYKHEWIWFKSRSSNPNLAKHQPLRHHESVLIFCKDKPLYNPQMEEGESYKTRKGAGGKFGGTIVNQIEQEVKEVSGRYPKSVLSCKSPYPNSIIHPTQKPVALFEYLIKTYTNPDMLILDNTAGSGTTAIAAINTGRKWVCIEQDETYYAKACERIENHIPPASLPTVEMTATISTVEVPCPID